MMHPAGVGHPIPSSASAKLDSFRHKFFLHFPHPLAHKRAESERRLQVPPLLSTRGLSMTLATAEDTGTVNKWAALEKFQQEADVDAFVVSVMEVN